MQLSLVAEAASAADVPRDMLTYPKPKPKPKPQP